MRRRRCSPLVLTLAAWLACSCAAAAATISLDMRDVDIFDAVRMIAAQTNANIVVDASVEHRPVTLRLRDVDADDALRTLATANGLEVARVDGVTYVGTPDVIDRRFSATTRGLPTKTYRLRNATADAIVRALERALPRGTLLVGDGRTSSVIVTAPPYVLRRASELIGALDRGSDVSERTIAMRYARAADVLRALTSAVPTGSDGSAYADTRRNAIVLSGPPEYLRRAVGTIADVDRPAQQVRYDVRVTDLAPASETNIGFLWGGANDGVGSISSTFLRNSYAIDVRLNALVQNNEARILARPTISSLNDVPASLLVGEQYPIVYFDARTGNQQVQFVDIGVNLHVTPSIGDDGAITTDLETDYSEVTGLNAAGFPIITTRRAVSTLRVRSDQTIVIAGLFSDIDRTTVTKVPLLGDLPLLGEVFKNRERATSKDEIVFLITPHLVADGGTGS